MRVAIIVNNPPRDLAGLSLLARELARNGATAFLVPMTLQGRELGALQPDFVLLNQFRTITEPLGRGLLAAGVPFGVLEDEGGVFPDFDWYKRQMTPEADLRQAVSLLCCWGPALANHIAEQGWYRPEAIAVTGHPRFDYYCVPWKEARLPHSPDTSGLKRPLVLINSRFSRVNPAFATPEEEYRVLVEKRGYTPQRAREFQSIMGKAMDNMIELANYLAGRFSQIQFVFRPHPFENMAPYEERLESHPNLLLTRSGDIGSWLAITDTVIHSNCTTAIEAGMLEIPALTPEWVVMPEPIETTEAVSIPISSMEEMERALVSLLVNGKTRPEGIARQHERVVEQFFCASDGLCHQRVAREILRVGSEHSGASKKAGAIPEFLEMPADAGTLQRMKIRMRQRGKYRERYAEWPQSDKAYDVEWVSGLLDALQVVSPIPGKVEARTSAADYCRKFPEGRSVTVAKN